MDNQAKRSSNQTNNIIGANFVDEFSFLTVASQYGSKNQDSETIKSTSTPERVQLWNQPSVRPIVRKVRLNGRKRTKKFAERSKLSFNKEVMVFEIPSVRDYSPPHRGQIWNS